MNVLMYEWMVHVFNNMTTRHLNGNGFHLMVADQFISWWWGFKEVNSSLFCEQSNNLWHWDVQGKYHFPQFKKTTFHSKLYNKWTTTSLGVTPWLRTKMKLLCPQFLCVNIVYAHQGCQSTRSGSWGNTTRRACSNWSLLWGRHGRALTWRKRWRWSYKWSTDDRSGEPRQDVVSSCVILLKRGPGILCQER